MFTQNLLSYYSSIYSIIIYRGGIGFLGVLVTMFRLIYLINSLITQVNHKYVYCDTPRPWGVYFQDSATPQMEGIVELHDHILFYLIIILFGVT